MRGEEGVKPARAAGLVLGLALLRFVLRVDHAYTLSDVYSMIPRLGLHLLGVFDLAAGLSDYFINGLQVSVQLLHRRVANVRAVCLPRGYLQLRTHRRRCRSFLL